jgi:DNA primase
MSTPVEQIKERLSIEDVVGSYVKLIRSGKNLKAKCPFHNEKTPSFYVSPDRGGYYCFGCGAKGDIFSFVEQFEGLDFMGALKLLAERAGVDISRSKESFSNYVQAKSEKDRLYAIMEEAAVFFEKNLWHVTSDDAPGVLAAQARDYIKKRGLTEKTMKEFRIGFVPNEWRLLYNHLRGKGFNDAEIEKAGLAKRPERGEIASAVASLYDRFRDRIMFPIFDSSGRVIAFSGRILHEDTGKKDTDGNTITAAKYLNSPDTPLYTKSTVLYGIDKAKQAIRERDYTILVEGQMDLVLSHQAGIKNTVAVSGTALADTLVVKDSGEKGAPNIVNNLGIVRRLSTNLILAFDSDAAGRKAAMRSAGIALTLGMDVKIADLPEGKDPADLVLADPESWKNVLRTAKPIIEFALDHVLTEVAEKKLDSRKVPALLRERVYPFIAMLSNQTDQGHYVKMVRERALGNAENEAIIWEDVNKLQKAAAVPAGARQTPAHNGRISANAELSHLDIIAKELFGLLAYLGREKILDVEGYYASVKTIAGDVRYHNLIASFEPSKDELAFKAEFFFGSTTDVRDDKSESALRRKVDEIILNFEEQIVRDDLARAMGRLPKVIESHDQTLSETLHKEIQELITKKSDIDRRRSLF